MACDRTDERGRSARELRSVASRAQQMHTVAGAVAARHLSMVQPAIRRRNSQHMRPLHVLRAHMIRAQVSNRRT